MRLLIDTNIFLEVIYNQRRAADAQTLLASDHHQFYISDFALHSIGVSLLNRGLASRWPDFISETILSGQVQVLTVPFDLLPQVTTTAQQLQLDFDDAYQYVVAEYNGLTLVSFDRDFDHTPRKRQSPQSINQTTPANNSSTEDQ
ncbi:MAG: PIN domain-containing protein [Acidobacteriota bacterium]|nr:PIN domain-containing protein [Acidobacteriota bacterium]